MNLNILPSKLAVLAVILLPVMCILQGSCGFHREQKAKGVSISILHGLREERVNNLKRGDDISFVVTEEGSSLLKFNRIAWLDIVDSAGNPALLEEFENFPNAHRLSSTDKMISSVVISAEAGCVIVTNGQRPGIIIEKNKVYTVQGAVKYFDSQWYPVSETIKSNKYIVTVR